MARDAFSLFGFYERRARRILPALFVMLLAVMAAGFVLQLPHDYRAAAGSGAATTAFLSNAWFSVWATDYFFPGSDFAPLLHTWSLAVEEQFYFLFPFVLLAAAKLRAGALPVIVALSAASFALSLWWTDHDHVRAFYATPARAWELGLGAALALATWPQQAPRWLREAMAVLGLALIATAIAIFDESTRMPGWAALAPALGAALIIAAGSGGRSWAAAILSAPPLVFVGLISYSLYLWHWPLLSFARIRLDVVDLPWAVATGCVAAAFAVAAASWRLVEQPFRRRAFLSRRAVFALSAAGAATIGAGFAAVYISDGAPQRFSPAELKLVAGGGDINPRRQECFEGSVAAPWCAVGAPASAADFLFWGDSHADAVMPGVDAAARDVGLSGVVAGRLGCPPLLGVERPDYPTCRTYNEAVIARLRTRPDIAHVVLYARWTLFHSGVLLPGEEGTAIVLLDAAAPQAGQPLEAVFEAGLARTVAAIRSTGRTVTIIEGTPEFGWDVPQRLFAQARWGDQPPPPPTRAQMLARHAPVRAVFAELARDPGVRRVSLLAPLCPDACAVTHDGHPLYVDDDHVSSYAAARVLRPYLADALVWAPR